MSTALRIIKVLGCWVCIVAGVGFAIFMNNVGAMTPFGVMAIAFATAPIE